MVILMIVHLALVVVLAYVLFQRYRSTRNAGYLVLSVPLVLWSFLWSPVAALLRSQVDRHMAGGEMAWPLSALSDMSAGSIVATVNYGGGLIETILLILGFVWLGRSDRRVRAAPPNDV